MNIKQKTGNHENVNSFSSSFGFFKTGDSKPKTHKLNLKITSVHIYAGLERG